MADDFAQYCCELLSSLGPCVAKRMFGGYSLQVDGLPIGLIAYQVFYLKVDAQTKEQFRAAGATPFVYGEKDKPMEMSYWTVPQEAMDSPALMRPWAELAMQASLRSANKPKKNRTATAPKAASKKPPVR
jgi:DNA transformation protein and related proteins